jgi:signal transduction histidine kinase
LPPYFKLVLVMKQTNADNLNEFHQQLLMREQSARAQAEAANRIKDEFLTTLSHEMRTPLNSILGWVTLLRNQSLTESEAQKALEVIERNARSQSHLINDLLDVSSVINGKLRLTVRTLMPEVVIRKAVESVRSTAAAKNIRLLTDLDAEAGPVLADADRLRQIVWNLLINAIKFTPKDGRVEVNLVRAGMYLEIIISDAGIGIEQDLLLFVFDRFRQGDSSMTRKFGGLGMGLAMVRHLVEMHGGTVSVESGRSFARAGIRFPNASGETH